MSLAWEDYETDARQKRISRSQPLDIKGFIRRVYWWRVLGLGGSLLFCIVCWTCLLAHCQELPNAPSSTPHSYWIVVGAYTGSILADDITTQHGKMRGCVETNNPLLYGRYPNQARFLAISFGFEALEVLATRRMVRSKSRFWRSIGYSELLSETGLRGSSAFGNTRSNCY